MLRISLFLAAIFALPVNVYALRYEVVGACSPLPVFSGEYEPTDANASAGSASVAIFERDKIPYIGTAGGINSILNTPVGAAAMEIISATEMRVYGWCYEVDGVEPNVMPDGYPIAGKALLKWYYTYSEYKGGDWVSYCRPAHEIRPPSLCP